MTALLEPAGPATLLPEAVAGLALHVRSGGGSTMRPLVYGYIRLTSTDAADCAARLTRELAAYAEREGMTLAEVFSDRDDSGSHAGRAGFIVMVQALQRPGVYGVLIPSLRHFSRFPGVHTAMCELIQVQTGARVLPIDLPPGSPP